MRIIIALIITNFLLMGCSNDDDVTEELVSDNPVAEEPDVSVTEEDIVQEPSTKLAAILSNISSPKKVAIKENFLYFSQEIDFPRRTIISKVDITESNPKIIDVFEPNGSVNAMVFNGNELYMSMPGGFFGSDSKISKIDVTKSNPTLIDVVTGLNTPLSMAFHGDNLYLSAYTVNKILKIDISATTPIATDFMKVLDPRYLVFHGDNLYIGKPTAKNFQN